MYTTVEIGGMSLVTLFSLAAVATAVIFVVYAAEWGENTTTNMNTVAAGATGNAARDQQNRLAKAEYAYYATVILILMVITGMHGFVIARELL